IRQIEMNGAQTVPTGAGNAKTWDLTNFRLLGGANNSILITDGSGNLSWVTAPGGGLLFVSTDGTLDGDGTALDPLSVLHWAAPVTIDLQVNPTGGTQITVNAADIDGTADAILTNFEITVLDGGTF